MRCTFHFTVVLSAIGAMGSCSSESSHARVPGAGGFGGAGGSSAGSTNCSFDATYAYGFVGGLQAYTDLVTLSPPASFTLVRTPAPGDTMSGDSGSCAPPVPRCGSADTIAVSDIMADIADPVVQGLISQTLTQDVTLGVRAFGDSPIFSFQKSGTAGFFVGSACLDGGIGTCTPVPDAVSKLMNDLVALDEQQRMDPMCSGPLSSGFE